MAEILHEDILVRLTEQGEQFNWILKQLTVVRARRSFNPTMPWILWDREGSKTTIAAQLNLDHLIKGLETASFARYLDLRSVDDSGKNLATSLVAQNRRISEQVKFR